LGPAHSKWITIRGLVIPAEWDETGNVIALAISTFDEDEYIIEKNREEGRLYSLIRKEIEASGIIRDSKGKKRIEVRDYKTR
jgi:hypothetical protein